LGQRQRSDVEPLAPLPDDVPAELRTLVAKALEHEPADRYQSMRDLVVDLRRVVRGSATAAAARPTTATRRSARHVAAYVAAGLALLAGAAIVSRYYTSGDESAPTMIAVLPFVGESAATLDDRPADEGFADALRDELAPVPGLRVAARASSVALGAQNLDMRTIASRLNVAVLVTGTVRRNVDDTFDVSVEIVDGDTGARDFAKRYDGSLLTVQRQLANDVSAFLSGGVAAPIATATNVTAAARALIAADYLFREVRDSPIVDADRLSRAIDYYRRAVAADPQSEIALSRLAGALLYGGKNDEALENLNQALTFGKRSETHYTLALYALSGGPETAHLIEPAFEQAIELDGDNVDAVGDYALWRWVHRPAESAEPLFKHALALDPQSLSRYSSYAEFLGSYERKEDLLAVATLIETRFPDARGHRAIARVHELLGDIDVAIGWMLKALEAQRDLDTELQLAELYARIGDFDSAALYEPEPVGISQLYLQQRYPELAALGLEKVLLEDGIDASVGFKLAFAHNMQGRFAEAINLLEYFGLPESALADSYSSGDSESLVTWADAQIASGFAEETRDVLERYVAAMTRNAGRHTMGWWNNAHVACALADLDRTEEALELIERIRSNMGLIWRPLLEDTLCFKRFRDEPRYQAVVQNVRDRQKALRERLPKTLREQFPELSAQR
jgi:TolB-like protein